jgi:hypothetical protein
MRRRGNWKQVVRKEDGVLASDKTSGVTGYGLDFRLQERGLGNDFPGKKNRISISNVF